MSRCPHHLGLLTGLALLLASCGGGAGDEDDRPPVPAVGGMLAFELVEGERAVGFIDATDPEGDRLHYRLADRADGDRFSIDGDGALRFVDEPDFEAPDDRDGDNVYELTAVVSDGRHDVQVTVEVTVEDADEPPMVEIPEAATVHEGERFVLTCAASDPDTGSSPVFALLPEGDAGCFTIDEQGRLSFAAPPDHEAPGDADDDNGYELAIEVQSGGSSLVHRLTVSVLDDEEAPVLVVPETVALAEGACQVLDCAASDPDAGSILRFSLASPDGDAERFTIDDQGSLRFRAPPDFEAPVDADQDNVYAIAVLVDDGTYTITRALTVRVADRNEAPLLALPTSGTIDEGETVVLDCAASDPDAGTALELGLAPGDDAALFTIDAQGRLCFLAPPDHEQPGDADHDNRYEVEVVADDGVHRVTRRIAVLVADCNEPPVLTVPATATVAENRLPVLTASVFDPDAGDNPTMSIAGGADAGCFRLDPLTGALRFRTVPDYELPADADGDNVYHVSLGATDGELSVEHQVVVTVSDQEPEPYHQQHLEAVVARPLTLALAVDEVLGEGPVRITTWPQHGSLSRVSDTSYTYRSDEGFTGEDALSYRYEAHGGGEVCGLIAISVLPVNTPPVASGTMVRLEEGGAVVVELAELALDADGHALTYALAVDVAHGQVTWLDATRIEYRPEPGFSGPDTLTYAVEDERGAIARATISFLVSSTDVPAFAETWRYSILGQGIGLAGFAWGDLDGDGVSEIVAGHSTATFGANDAWSLLEHTGDEAAPYVLTRQVSYPTTIRRILAYQAQGLTGSRLVVLTADGQLELRDAPDWGILTTIPTGLADGTVCLGDVDNDGQQELVVSTTGSSRVYQAQTLAFEYAFAYGHAGSAIGDVDGDGANELVLRNGQVLAVAADGTVTLQWSYASGFGNIMRLGDVDDDGRDEIVAAAAWYDIDIIDYGLAMPSRQVEANLDIDALRLIDVSGDGRPEILYGDAQHGEIHCIDVSGDENLELWQVPTPVSGISDIVVGDLDGDGERELMWGSGHGSTGQDQLNIHDLATRALEYRSIDIDGPFHALALGDADGDGEDEIVTISFESESGYDDGIIHVFDAATKVLEQRSASHRFEGRAWTGVHDVDIADVDDDGEPEIVVATDRLYDGAIYVLDGRTLAQEALYLLDDGSPIYRVSHGDIDGDGATEIIAAAGKEHTGSPGTYIYRLDGGTGAVLWHSVDLGAGWNDTHGLEVADVTGDGRDDVVAVNLRCFVLDGASGVLSVTAEDGYRGLGLGDMTGDGVDDIVVGRSDGTIRLFDGGLTMVDEYPIGAGPAGIDGVALVDVNGDALSDVVCTHDGQLSILAADFGGLLLDSMVVADDIGVMNAIIGGSLTGPGIVDLIMGYAQGLVQISCSPAPGGDA